MVDTINRQINGLARFPPATGREELRLIVQGRQGHDGRTGTAIRHHAFDLLPVNLVREKGGAHRLGYQGNHHRQPRIRYIISLVPSALTGRHHN